MSDKDTKKTTLTLEQEKVVNHINGDLLVSASAGSGKTHTMIERLISLVSNGYTSIDKILALTFTDASANDMKNKLKSALTDKINGGGYDHLIGEIDKVYTADISTIDSFCIRLVRKYFFIAGVSPDFGIGAEGVEELLKAEAMEQTFREYYALNDQKFLLLVDRFSTNRRDAGLKKAINEIYDHVDSESDFNRLFNSTLKLYSKLSFKSQLLEIRERIDAKLKDASRLIDTAEDGLSELGFVDKNCIILELKSVVENLKNSSSLYDMKRVFPLSKRLSFGNKLSDEVKFFTEKIKKANEIVKEIIADLKTYLTSEEEDEIQLEKLKSDSEKIFEIVTKYKENYDRLKKEENLLDFTDAERCALKILKDERARESISSEYEFIFIDEYQDVNAIQEEIINILSRDNLFMVGDVKQSIYGFRGCRPDYFENKYRLMKNTEGATAKLNYNFRSAPAVIDAINDVFCFSMTKDYYGVDYLGESELKYGGLFGDFKGRASFNFYQTEKEEREKEEPRIYDVEEEIKKPVINDFSNTLSLVVKIIEEELKLTRYDLKKKREVPVTYGDIAILTRGRSTNYVTDLIRGLSALNIPVTSVAEENVGDYPEVRWFISLFDLLVCFNDDVALLTVMKSPIGDFLDEELLEITSFSAKERKEKYYSFSYAVKKFAKEGEGKVCQKTIEFIEYIDKLRYLSDFVSAGEILDRVMDEKNIEANILATSLAELKIDRIRYLRECCTKNGRAYSVKETSYAIKNNDKFLVRLSGGGENSIKFVSMHSSKGLEFPVVIVLGTEKALSDMDSSDKLLFDRELGFAVKNYLDESRESRQTPLRWLFNLRRKENLFKEELRLFYVALTRASSSLRIAYVGRADFRKEEFNGASRYIDFVPLSIPTKVYSKNGSTLPTTEIHKRQVLISERENKDCEIARNLNFKYPYINDTTLPLKSTATELNKTVKEEYYSVEKIFSEEVDEDRIERGVIAHKILENYDFSKDQGIRELSKTLVDNGTLTEEQIAKVDLDKIEKAIKGVDIPWLKTAKIYREKSFLLSLPVIEVTDKDSTEELLIQGQIDLLAIKGDKAVVIDYKYSKLSGERLKSKYYKQLDIYAKAVEKILKVKVEGKYLLNLISGETVIVD